MKVIRFLLAVCFMGFIGILGWIIGDETNTRIVIANSLTSYLQVIPKVFNVLVEAGYMPVLITVTLVYMFIDWVLENVIKNRRVHKNV